MRRLISILLVMGFVMPSAVFAQEMPSVPRKKVAVVLSGGGAKGVAHIGALRVIEEAGIPIDMIVGTSMGSIVGGLYSIGYTPDQLDSMVMSQNWGLLLSDRTERRSQGFMQREAGTKYVLSLPFGKKIKEVLGGGLVRGSNLEMLFTDLMVGYHDSVNFRKLPIPFACVAADAVDGSEVVFHEGVLPVAMRASMAIPGFFTPVNIGDRVLVDGGVVNNFPTDIAAQMGADIIIGVDVQTELRKKEELKTAPAIIGQLIDFAMQRQKYERNVTLADVYMKVDVEGYSSASFSIPALDSLIHRGTEAALREWDELIGLKEKINIGPQFTPEPHGPYVSLSHMGKFGVENISFEGMTDRDKKWVMRKSRISEHGLIDMRAIERCISILNATQEYSGIYHTLSTTDTPGKYNLDFHLTPVKGNSINLGVNFDTEEIASILVNGTFRLGKRTPSRVSLTGRFGKRILGQADLLLYPGAMSNFNFTYAFGHDEVIVNYHGRKYHNMGYNCHMANFGYNDMNFWRQSLKFSTGLRYERFFSRTSLSSNMKGDFRLPDPRSEGYVSYYANLRYESFDNHYFPHRGMSGSASFDLYTDDFLRYRGGTPFSAIALSWTMAVPLSRRFTLIPSVYGRMLSGNDIPLWYINMIGGKWYGLYVPHQMQFDGIGFIESAPNTFIATRLKAQQRIGRRHYISGTFNYAMGEEHFLNLFAGKHYFGASLNYGYDTPLGPLQASFNWSNVTNRPGFFLQFGYTF